MASPVDYERAWLRLKVVISEKASHGRRDLRDAMEGIEVECITEEALRAPTAQEPSPIRAAS